MQVYETHIEIVTLLKFSGKDEPSYVGYPRTGNADRSLNINGSSPGLLRAAFSPQL
jgi:hypothetical protein